MKFCFILILLHAIGTNAGPMFDKKGSTKLTQLYERVDLIGNYKFFGKDYNHTYVSTKGYLTFDNKSTVINAVHRNAWDGDIMLAPYWSNNDIRHKKSGKVLYKESQDYDMLDQAQKLIQRSFRGCGDLFLPTSLFIVTYVNVEAYCKFDDYYYYDPYDNDFLFDDGYIVGYDYGLGYDQDDTHVNPPQGKNYFQAVLATDGCDTFVIIYFRTIEWKLCWRANKMLFNAGNGVGFYWNREPNLDKETNAKRQGRWIYKISEKQIRDTGCGVIGT